MISQAHGNNTLDIEIGNISIHGIWLIAHGKELFMSYEDFPWFKDQTIGSILKVEEQSPGHFYWPELDVDLTTEIIENPKRFPFKSKISKSIGFVDYETPGSEE